ncbi:MAG TPA: hypothetical protein VFS67_28745 [Polyangiaceae bacterium]|nr:hypothetical protein [Polyangiaceae bacterium]
MFHASGLSAHVGAALGRARLWLGGVGVAGMSGFLGSNVALLTRSLGLTGYACCVGASLSLYATALLTGHWASQFEPPGSRHAR